MGYDASGSGQVILRKKVPDEVLALLSSAEFLVEDAPDGGLWLTFDYASYNDQIEDAMKALAPYVKSGEVQFTGEDAEHWRFFFHNGKVDNQDGTIKYEHGTTKYRTVNVGFQYEDPKEGLVDDETQFDLIDADFGTMFDELSHLFYCFAEENGWNDSNCWISYVEEVPYDGEEE